VNERSGAAPQTLAVAFNEYLAEMKAFRVAAMVMLGAIDTQD
jgi:hypothetical protein